MAAEGVNGVHVAEELGLEGGGLFFLVKGEGELLEAFDEGAAEVELHVPEGAAHEADEGGVDERVLQEQEEIGAGDEEDFVEGAGLAPGEEVHDHAHGEGQEGGGRLLDDVEGHGAVNAAALVGEQAPEGAARVVGIETPVEELLPSRWNRGPGGGRQRRGHEFFPALSGLTKVDQG